MISEIRYTKTECHNFPGLKAFQGDTFLQNTVPNIADVSKINN